MKKVPLLERDIVNEQELVSAVVWGHKDLGIRKIIKVQTRFPDMLVNVKGKEVYLELEVYSLGFREHINDLRYVSEGKFKGKRRPRLKDEDDSRPVAVLCWVDDDTEHELRRRVPKLRVNELQSLLRNRKKIVC